MTELRFPVDAEGPIVPVEVGFLRSTIADLRRAGRPVLTPLRLNALVDTGADLSMIDQGLLTPFVQDGMGLRAFVYVNAPGVGGLRLSPQFTAGFRVKHPSGSPSADFVMPAVELVEYRLEALPYQVIIGRDILSRCVFTYDGPADSFSLTY